MHGQNTPLEPYGVKTTVVQKLKLQRDELREVTKCPTGYALYPKDKPTQNKILAFKTELMGIFKPRDIETSIVWHRYQLDGCPRRVFSAEGLVIPITEAIVADEAEVQTGTRPSVVRSPSSPRRLTLKLPGLSHFPTRSTDLSDFSPILWHLDHFDGPLRYFSVKTVTSSTGDATHATERCAPNVLGHHTMESARRLSRNVSTAEGHTQQPTLSAKPDQRSSKVLLGS